MKEEFRIIKEYPNYQVSNLGRVKSIRKILKPSFDGWGYYKITLCKDGKIKTAKIHRLVMDAFVGKSKLHVNHKNGIKHDNRLENLEYVTRSENMKHAFKHGLCCSKGENHSQAIFNWELVNKIREIPPNVSNKEVARMFNISRQNAYDIRSGRRWKKEGNS